MPPPLKLENQKFGRLTVVKRVENNKKNDSCWLCQCECGNTRIVASPYLKKRGFELHCGSTHHKSEKHRKNVTGKVFGYLTALRFVCVENKHTLWEFQCKCGKIIIRPLGFVGPKQIQSCGCYKKETRIQLAKNLRQWHSNNENYDKWNSARKAAIKYGPDNPIWNHSKSIESRHAERYERKLVPGYTQWRHLVYQRDKWTCQKCKEKSGKLRAHHIKPYTLFKEYRTIVENGITLCESCHVGYHKQYGSKENCNQETLELFLRS